MGHAIFISYRRDDTEGEAGRLFDDLTRAFGENCVFMDVAGIKPGTDFRKAIEDNVVTCGVLLAVIGPSWVTIKDAAGNLRLADPNDFVGLEISSALKRDVPVIPVLVHDAKMPHPESVPDSLKDLCYRNSVELSHARWNSDVGLLINALKAYVKSTPTNDQDPVHATVSVQLPPPHPIPTPAKRSISPLLQGAGAAVLVILAAIIFFASHGHQSQPSPSPMPAPVENNSGGDSSPVVTSTPAANTGTTTTPAATTTGGKASSPPVRDGAANAERPDSDTTEQASPVQGDGEQGGQQRLMGKWVYPEAIPGDNLAYIQMGNVGNQLAMHAWGNCKPNPCDWGTQPAAFDGHGATATFVFPPNYDQTAENRVATIRAMPGLNGLDVAVHNTFTNVYGVVRTVNVRLQFVPFQQ